jgi:phenylpropionate dioxygenase-like ring-hydroxylating dioxygenase large terminal subunit
MSRTAAEYARPPQLPSTHFVDNRVYYDEGIFAEEKEKILSKTWRFVMHESEVPEVYDYRTATIADAPLVVSRGKDNKIRTFINSCSHRGASVLRRPAGNLRAWQCMYHLWTYDPTTGECISRPRPEAFDAVGLRQEACGLREVKTEVMYGLVFVNLDDNCMPLAEYIGDSMFLQKEMIDTVEMEVIDFFELPLHCNWKNWMETNMDLYHEFMHVANRKTSLMIPEYYKRNWHTFSNGHFTVDRYSVEYDKYPGWEDRNDNLALPGMKEDEFQITDLFPDITFLTRGTVVRIDNQIPLSPTETLVQYRALGIKGEPEEDRMRRIRDYHSIWGLFGRNLPEDCLGVTLQRNAVYGGQVPYTYWCREENNLSQDDVAARTWWKEWSRLMGKDQSWPFGTAPSEAAE